MIAQAPITLAEFEALPDDGVRRWVVDGILHEESESESMSQRNRFHSLAMTKIGRYLDEWNDQQPTPRGRVLTGDAGFVLETDPMLSYGVDAAYVNAETWNRQEDETTTMVLGLPVLAVEIISPSTTMEDNNEKIRAFLDRGVPLVWVLDPYWKVVDIYRPQHKKTTLNTDHVLTGHDVLPGFSVPVAKLFE